MRDRSRAPALAPALVAALLVGLLAPAARANAPLGHTDIAVDGGVNPIIDPSGTRTEPLLSATIEYTMTVDSAGRVGGTGEISHPILPNPLPCELEGRLRGRGSDVELRWSCSFKERTGDTKVRGKASERIRIDVEADTYDRDAQLDIRVDRERLRERGSEERRPLSELFGGSVDGGWTVALDVSTAGRELTATATQRTSTNRAFAFAGKGSFSERKDQSRIDFKAVEKGVTLKLDKLVTGPFGLEAGEIRYRALGQSGKAVDWLAFGENPVAAQLNGFFRAAYGGGQAIDPAALPVDPAILLDPGGPTAADPIGGIDGIPAELEVTVGFTAPDPVTAVAIRFGPTGTTWSVPLAAPAGSGSAMLPLPLPPEACNGLSIGCHQVDRFSYAITAAGTISPAGVSAATLVCGSCEDGTCQALLPASCSAP